MCIMLRLGSMRGTTSASSSTWFGNPKVRVMSLGPRMSSWDHLPYFKDMKQPAPLCKDGKKGWKEGLLSPGAAWELASGCVGVLCW